MATQYAIFDLDNCLADDAWRIPYIDWTKTDPVERYAAYHSKCWDDHVGNKQTYDFWVRTKKVFPVFLTGRPTSQRGATVDWLRSNGFVDEGQQVILLMRNERDRRPSVDVKRDQVLQLWHHDVAMDAVVAAYDDRQEIVDMYHREFGFNAAQMQIHDVCAYTPPAGNQKQTKTDMQTITTQTAADILAEAAETYRQRNAVYGSNFRMVGPMMKILFPDGVPAEVLHSDQFHLFELILVKISRYAVSNLTHIDSMRDAAVYAAMCEAINHQQGQKQ